MQAERVAPEIEPSGWWPRRGTTSHWALLARPAHCHAHGCNRRIAAGEVAAIYDIGGGETALACRQCAEVPGTEKDGRA